MKMKISNPYSIQVIDIEGTVEECVEFFNKFEGEWVDIAAIPKCFGEDLLERIKKYWELRKDGMCLYDSQQMKNDSIL